MDIVPCCISWRSPCLFNDFFLIPIHQFVCIIWIHGMILMTKVLASIQGSCNCSLPTWTTWIMHRIHQLCKTFVLTSKIVTVQDFHYLTKIVTNKTVYLAIFLKANKLSFEIIQVFCSANSISQYGEQL